MPKYIIGLASISMILGAGIATAQQLQLNVEPSAGTFTGSTNPVTGGGLPMKIDVDRLSKSIVDLGGAPDKNALAKSLEKVLEHPAYSPDYSPSYGPGAIPSLDTAPSFGPTAAPNSLGGISYEPPTSPKQRLAIASGNIGLLNQTMVTFSFLVTRSDGTSKSVTLSAGEFRTFECSTDCLHGFKVKYTSGDASAVKEIEMTERVVFEIMQDGAEWAIRQTAPSDWYITHAQ